MISTGDAYKYSIRPQHLWCHLFPEKIISDKQLIDAPPPCYILHLKTNTMIYVRVSNSNLIPYLGSLLMLQKDYLTYPFRI